MDLLLKTLAKDFPSVNFAEGKDFFWSADNNLVTYKQQGSIENTDLWTLLHEVGHALLNHKSYSSDVELLLLEVEAWQKAQELAQKYQIIIDEDHIQDYLDTYRDWLHKRSACPVCNTHSLQKSARVYACFNCKAQWQVTKERFCRPYRIRMLVTK